MPTDIAWSEYNHHWAGLFVVAIGLLALLNRAGVRLGAALAVGVHRPGRCSCSSAPIRRPGRWAISGFFESFRDVEVLQHRAFVLLIVVFALFEWRVRVGGLARGTAVLVFPLLCAGGGTLLLTHSHAIANLKDQLLIELTHTPLALAGIAAGWARWLEIRLDPRQNPVVWRRVRLALAGLSGVLRAAAAGLSGGVGGPRTAFRPRPREYR